MSDMDAFLKGNSGQAEASQPSVAEEPRGEPQLEPQPASEPAAVIEDEDGGTPPPEGDTVPRAAYLAERTKRQDHKGRADKLEGELRAREERLAALEAQLADARKAAAPSPAPAAETPAPEQPRQPQAIPDPREDPQGYAAYVEGRAFSTFLNTSEMMLREKHDSASVDEAVATFKQAIAKNPALYGEFQRQPNPYRWMYDYVQRNKALDEIGADPAAYRAKLEADMRAQLETDIRSKLEAEMAARTPAPPPVKPPVTLPPSSIGTGRSAAARSAPVWTGPPPIEDIFAK